MTSVMVFYGADSYVSVFCIVFFFFFLTYIPVHYIWHNFRPIAAPDGSSPLGSGVRAVQQHTVIVTIVTDGDHMFSYTFSNEAADF